MPRVTINDKVAGLSDAVKQKLEQRARDGESISAMAGEFGLDYAIVQTYLWNAGTLPWRGAKVIITRRLRSLRAATKRGDRERLADEVREQVDYLYYAARQLQDQLERAKRSLA